jgi:Cdc6-like AAA superfamily ATPase
MKADMTGKQRESTPAEEPANVGPNENGPDYERLSILGTVFTPAAPIDDEDLFRGRIEQLDMVIQSILRVGQHSIVYGDRGVGKTSLVNVVEPILQKAGENTSIRAVRVTCDASDSFR